MNQVILASHGQLSAGAKDSVGMIVGNLPNVHSIVLLRDDKRSVAKEAEDLIANFDMDDDVYILTDMLGSSVNNSMSELLLKYPNLIVISGMNLPLILEISMNGEKLTGVEINRLIEQSRLGIQNVRELLQQDIEEDGDLL